MNYSCIIWVPKSKCVTIDINITLLILMSMCVTRKVDNFNFKNRISP